MISGRRSYNTQGLNPIVSLSEPDALSFHRYFDRWRGAAGYLQPEKRLMLAVLLDAVECFQKYPFARRSKVTRQVEDKEDWIFKDDQEWPFSFINICEAVGIDPQYLRNGLSRWKQKAIQEEYQVPPIVPNQ
jgi:hypothetical protein